MQARATSGTLANVDSRTWVTRRTWQLLLVMAVSATTCSVLPEDRAAVPPPLDIPAVAAFHGMSVLPASGRDVALRLWSGGDLDATTAAAVARVPGVTAVAHLSTGTVGLLGSRDATGAPVDVLDEAWQIPVGVAAVDPTQAATFADASVRDAVAALRPDAALLTRTAAARRGLGVGARLDLVGAPDLEVVAVVPDGTLSDVEMIVHAAVAGPLGLSDHGSLLVAARRPDANAVTRTLPTLVEGDDIRVVDLRDTEAEAPVVLSLQDTKSTFGEFAIRPRDGVRDISIEGAWIDANIVVEEVPILGRVRCHRAIIEPLRTALQDVIDAGLADTIDPSRYQGCFVPRRIDTTGANLSHHSWGMALDINVDLNLPDGGPPPHPDVIDAFARAGFRWGGLFLNPDNHHFEWVGDAATTAPPVSR